MTYHHTTIEPLSTYSPWVMDPDFNQDMQEVMGNTLLDIYRLYELWKLAGESAKLDSGHFLEVGTFRGGSGAIIASKAARVSPEETVFLCDTFEGLVKLGERDSSYFEPGWFSAPIENTLDLLKRKNLTNVRVLAGVFPDQTGHEIEDLTFRFAHVDVDIYESALDVSEWLWPRLVRGGIVVYDDYGFQKCDGITYLVEEQMKLSDRICIHNLNGHAIIIKL